MRLLEPVVRLLLDAGVGVGEMQQMLKKLYVQAALASSKDPRSSVSRIAALTGIPRGQVGAILRSTDQSGPPTRRGIQRAERVLRGWWTDPDFCDAHGRPLPLPLRGTRGSFVSLVKRYSGDPRARTLLHELLRVKAVRRLPDRRLEVLSRSFATVRWDSQGVALLGEQARDLLENLVHNLQRPQQPRYVRFILNDKVDPDYVPMLIRDLTQQAESFADRCDDALSDPNRTLNPTQAAQPATRLGVGIFILSDTTSVAPTTEPLLNVSVPRRRGSRVRK